MYIALCHIITVPMKSCSLTCYRKHHVWCETNALLPSRKKMTSTMGRGQVPSASNWMWSLSSSWVAARPAPVRPRAWGIPEWYPLVISAWWYTYPSWKIWKSMGRMTSHILWKNKKCLKPPTSKNIIHYMREFPAIGFLSRSECRESFKCVHNGICAYTCRFTKVNSI